MTEFQVLEQALDLATVKGAFERKQVVQLDHCIEIVKSKLTDYEKVKKQLEDFTKEAELRAQKEAELKAKKEAELQAQKKPGPTLNKMNHK